MLEKALANEGLNYKSKMLDKDWLQICTELSKPCAKKSQTKTRIPKLGVYMEG